MSVLSHNAYHEIGPKYLTELITKKKMSYNFRPVNDFLLTSPKLKKLGVVIGRLRKVHHFSGMDYQ